MRVLLALTLARSARIAVLAVPAAVSLGLLPGTAAAANPGTAAAANPGAAAAANLGAAAAATVGLTRVSHDIYTDPPGLHKTEVEPDTFQAGSTIVSAFQVGRVPGAGASNIGWATSANRGATWSHGYLPGITVDAGGRFGEASDAVVARAAGLLLFVVTPSEDSSSYNVLCLAGTP